MKICEHVKPHRYVSGLGPFYLRTAQISLSELLILRPTLYLQLTSGFTLMATYFYTPCFNYILFT